MYYKIVATDDDCPGDPNTYTGEVCGEPNDHPILAALATEFGERKGRPAVQDLARWSEGEAAMWDAAMADGQSSATFRQCGVTYDVRVSDDRFVDRTPCVDAGMVTVSFSRSQAQAVLGTIGRRVCQLMTKDEATEGELKKATALLREALST